MKGNIIGIKPVNFTNDKTGEVIQGNKLYVVSEDMDCYGKSCSDIWVGSGTPLEKKLLEHLREPMSFVGAEVDFSFKPKSSKVAQFEVVKLAK